MKKMTGSRTRRSRSPQTIRKTAIRFGGGLLLFLLLLCIFEIKKESIAAGIYEEMLYRATAQGRWIRYGQYEQDTMYGRILDQIPLLHYVRIRSFRENSLQEKVFHENIFHENSFHEDIPSNALLVTETNERNTENKQDKITETAGHQDDKQTTDAKIREENQSTLTIRYAYGSVKPLPTMPEKPVVIPQKNELQKIFSTVKEQYHWKESSERERFLRNYYIADSSVGAVSAVIDGETLLSMDTSLGRITEEPQILIYHTHGTEGYQNSRKGEMADTVVGMGDILCEELVSKGFSVIHDRTTYDFVNGKDNRNYAYTTARPQIEATLQKYPSIRVVLDIHRDSGAARKTVIDGKDTAQIMLFNGLCRNADGPIEYLPNPYLDETLAFSLQMNLLGRERYPGLMYKLYLKNYRYNMHFRDHCMLVELGTEKNTVEEAQHAIRLFSELLAELLTQS